MQPIGPLVEQLSSLLTNLNQAEPGDESRTALNDEVARAEQTLDNFMGLAQSPEEILHIVMAKISKMVTSIEGFLNTQESAKRDIIHPLMAENLRLKTLLEGRTDDKHLVATKMHTYMQLHAGKLLARHSTSENGDYLNKLISSNNRRLNSLRENIFKKNAAETLANAPTEEGLSFMLTANKAREFHTHITKLKQEFSQTKLVEARMDLVKSGIRTDICL